MKSVQIPSIQSQINQVKALGAPSGDQPKISAILTASQQALAKVEKNPSLIASNGPSPFVQAAKQLHAYGLTACAPNA